MMDTRLKSTRLWWAVAMAALLLGTLGVAARKGRVSSAELDQLRAEVESLKSRQQEKATVVVREVRTEVAAPPSPSTAPIPLVPQPVLTPEEKERRAQAYREALEHLYDDTFAREIPDAEWAQSAVRTIRERYAGKEFPGLKLSAECKKTICRMEFTFADSEGFAAAHKLVETDPWPSHRFTRVLGDQQKGTMYISREGADLPQLDPTTVSFAE